MVVELGSEYWLISIKTLDSKKSLEECKSATKGVAEIYAFHVPDLKVGTLDSLMALSDELINHDSYIENVIKRVSRFILETVNNEMDKLAESLRIHDQSLDDYARTFRWDMAKYPIKQSLKNIVEIIIKLVSQVENDMKIKSTHYNTLRTTLANIQKRNTGGLLTRCLNEIVKKEDFVLNSDFLMTVLVVVPKNAFSTWWSEYETLIPMVVPRSSKMLHEDNDSGLMSVIIFKKYYNEFRSKVMEKKFSIREYQFDEDQIKKERREYAKLQNEKDKIFAVYSKWLKVNFADTFCAWFHIKTIRVFVESVLRYGLPVSFQAILIEPNRKHCRKLREILAHLYSNMDRKAMDISPEDLKIQDDSFGAVALSKLEPNAEYFSYVSFTIKTKLLELTDSYA